MTDLSIYNPAWILICNKYCSTYSVVLPWRSWRIRPQQAHLDNKCFILLVYMLSLLLQLSMLCIDSMIYMLELSIISTYSNFVKPLTTSCFLELNQELELIQLEFLKRIIKSPCGTLIFVLPSRTLIFLFNFHINEHHFSCFVVHHIILYLLLAMQ